MPQISLNRHSPKLTPTPLHRQIKALHEALTRIFFHALGHKRHRQPLQAQQRDHAWRQRVPFQLQMTITDVHTRLAGAQLKAVKEALGNVTEATRHLGISRATVYRKLGNPKAC